MPDPISDALSPDTQVALLLHGRFGAGGGPKPLTLGEFNRLGVWLGQENLRPSVFLDVGAEFLDRLPDTVADLERVRALLGRGAALAFAVEDWVRRGLWVVGRADAAYPTRLRETLKGAAPPLLYGAGDLALVDGPTLGLVGSRDADERALAVTRDLGERCAREGVRVVSGGAKGVDWEAMQAALSAGGEAVGVLAEGVAKPATSKRYRDALAGGRLALLSPVVPGARWATYQAMGRNKMVYALSDRVLVVASDTRGGTWEGATEALTKSWGSVLVRMEEGVPVGNRRLAELGAAPVSPAVLTAAPSLDDGLRSAVASRPGDLFSPAPPAAGPPAAEPGGVAESPASYAPSAERGLFEVVWPHLAPHFAQAVPADGLASVADALHVEHGQLAAWLRVAVEAGRVEKTTRPVRYVLRGT